MSDEDFDVTSEVPLVLLPLRIETRFTLDGSALRVRIWPDDLHVDPLGPGLREGEREPAEQYWGAVWADLISTDQAWSTLVQAVGGRRAAWVAEQTRPVNWADRDPADTQSPPPSFPVVGPAAATGPQVLTLPTRFVVEVRQGDETRRVPGELVPDVVSTALLGDGLPSPAAIEGGALPVSEAARWMTDYEEAERVGMAVTVPLPFAGQRIDHVAVAGVKQVDPTDGARLLHDLLRAHRFSSGAAFVDIGTPTNNADGVRSGVDRHDAPVERTIVPQPPAAGTDGALAASALGVEATAFADWPGASADGQRRAGAFVAALFATTVGTFLTDRFPSSSQGGIGRPGSGASVRRHAITHLRGRGPLPPLRVGAQPYGVLPITLDTDFESGRVFWRAGAEDVPTVMAGDLDRHLPDLLGTLPVSTGVRVRTVAEANRSFGRAIGLPFVDDTTLLEARATAMATNLTAFSPTHVKTDGLLGRADRQLAIPMVDPSDLEFVALLARRMDGDQSPLPDPASLLQALLAHAVIHLEVETTSIATGIDLDELGGTFIELADRHGLDAGLVREALREVLQDQPADAAFRAAEHIEEQVGVADLDGIRDRPIAPAMEPRSALSIALGQAGAHRVADDGRELLQVLGARFAAARVRAEVRAALDVIAEVTDDEARRIHLMEYLDVCSHRLDAWITSVASARLAARTAARREPGTVIGAYGYVEGVEPSNPVAVAAAPAGLEGADLLRDRHPGGYVHAPSPAHAATAAVLRAGRLNHFRGDANTAALDIDVSSARARLGRHLVEGIRRGQSLGALLGYRLERRLHEDTLELDRYIYVLRGLAPLLDAKLTEQAVAHEAIAANNVVDGLLLHDKAWEPTIRQALEAGPKDTRYLPGGVWPPPGPLDLPAVRAHIEALAADLDAVADVLLAESVHQLVGGNTARAAAALDSLGAGEAVPPDPDVIATPRSGTPIRHQVVVTVPPSAAAWNAMSPRALAEPALEAWVAAQLGPRAAWTVAGSTLDDTELGALDVAYESDGESLTASTLAWRVRRRFGPDADLAPLQRLWHLGAALRSVLTGGRTVTAGIDPVALRQRAGEAAQRLAGTVAAIVADPAADPVTTIADLAAHGVPIGTIPGVDATPELVDAIAAGMVREAERRLTVAASQLAAADDAVATADVAAPDAARTAIIERSLDATHTVLGEGFCIVAPTAAVLQFETGDPTAPVAPAVPFAATDVADGRDIRPWLTRMGTVRGALGRYGQALVVRESLGTGRRHLRAAQHGWGPWVGAVFPGDVAPPTRPVNHVVVESADGTVPDGATEVGAFIVDSWVEVAPRRVARFDVDAAGDPVLRDITTPATTGLAIGANGPNARAPHVVLVATQPIVRRWNEGLVFAVVAEAIALAKQRTVTLERLPWAGRLLPALYFRDWSLQGRPVLDFSRLATTLESASAITKFVKE